MTKETKKEHNQEGGEEEEPVMLEENRVPELYSALSMEEHPFGESIFDLYEKIDCVAEDGTGGDVWIVKKKPLDSPHLDNDTAPQQSDEELLYVAKYIEKDFLFGTLLKELRNEVEAVRSIDHPNVIRTYETFETKELMYLVMEYCSGGDLWSRNLPYEEKEAARLLTQILSAVAHLHKHKIIHRDMKLENILYRSEEPDSDIVIIDFGLSQRYRSARGTGDYSMKMHVGTNYTISPQVIAGEYTEKTDLWSVGVIAYCMLSGKKPFDADTPQEILDQISEGKYNLQGPEWASISQGAKDFVSSLLEYDPDKRWSAEEALESTWLQQKTPVQEPDPEVMAQVEDALLHSNEEPKLKRLAKMIIAHSSTAEKLEELRQTFDALDQSHDGTITFEEFQSALQQSQTTSDDDADLLSSEQLREIFDELDQSQTGVIHYTEFLSATLETTVDIDDRELTEAFERLDVHNNGSISKEDITEVLEPTCKHNRGNSGNIAEELLKEVHADDSSTAEITYEEFTEMFQDSPSQH